jgi:uncharacterized membrane protein HdeD (DUF308 family)
MIKKLMGVTLLFIGLFVLNLLPITIVGISACLVGLILIVEGIKLIRNK